MTVLCADQETVRLLGTAAVTAISTLLLAVISTVTAFRVGARSHERTVAAERDRESRQREELLRKEERDRRDEQEREARAALRQREAAARDKEEAAAIRLDVSFTRLGEDLDMGRGTGGASPVDGAGPARDVANRLLAAHAAVRADAAFLPQEWRDRLLFLRDVLRASDELGADSPGDLGYHYEPARVLRRHALVEAHELLARYLRQQPTGPTSSTYKSLEIALTAYTFDREAELAADSFEAQDRKRRWVERFPQGRALL